MKQYELSKVINNVNAIQLRRDNIMEVLGFLGCREFSTSSDFSNSNIITGIHLDDPDFNTKVNFGEYVVDFNGIFVGYSEKEFNEMFKEASNELK